MIEVLRPAEVVHLFLLLQVYDRRFLLVLSTHFNPCSCVLQTALGCVPRGAFQCPLVVTMRPIPAGLLDTAVEVTHQNPLAHGAPVHVGDPGAARTCGLWVGTAWLQFISDVSVCSYAGDNGPIQTGLRRPGGAAAW